MSAEQIVTEAPEQHAPQASGDDHTGGFELDEDGQRVPHGMGQSKSSRRRRRKRKNKSGDAAPAGNQVAGSVESSGDSSVPAPEPGADVQPQSAPNGGFRQNGSQNGNGQGRNFQASAQTGGQQNGTAPGGTKRWKKKFRDHQPGNSAGGFKRKGGFGKQQQQRAPRGFVGPMDHSYRAVNGNVFDTPPSTVEPYGNYGNGNGGGGRARGYQSDAQPIDYSQGRVVPISPDAPTHIYFFIEDLFFIAKISETARKLGVKIAFVKNEKEQIAKLTDASEEDRPGLIVFDLNNAAAKPMTLIPKLKSKLKKTTSIVGFLSHLQGDLKAKAVEAGCDTVMPRAAFSQNLPNLLRRYGIEDVEEQNYNQ